MPKPLALLDVNYLAHRAFHTTRNLNYEEKPTGVIFGVMKTVMMLRDRFPGHKLVFCFDHGKGLREEIYEGYKSSRRKKLTADEESEIADFRTQINGLKVKYLPRCGFSNVFFNDGYEADDVIAKIIESYPAREAMIVSDDKDLYQLLSEKVSIYKPRTGTGFLYTHDHFQKEYGIPAPKWAKVKAIAGCSSDDVLGVPGVGEKTALQYLRGELPKDSNRYKLIKAYKDYWIRNMKVVKLPLDGIKNFRLAKDELTDEKWDGVIGGLGMASMTSNDFEKTIPKRGTLNVHPD